MAADARRRRREGQEGRLGRPSRRHLRRADQRPAHPPGRRRAARRRPPGHPRHQAPWRGVRFRPQAVQAEGHRSRPSGLDPHAAAPGGGIVHGPHPRDYSQRTPKKMIAAALRGALSDRARGERLHVVERAGDRRHPVDQGRGCADRGPHLGPATCSSCSIARMTSATRACATSATCTCCSWDQLNAYDVLVCDDIVFTKAASRASSGTGARPRRPTRRRTSDASPTRTRATSSSRPSSPRRATA